MARVKGTNYASDSFQAIGARRYFWGVPHQNDGGRGCHAAPDGVHPGMILWRLVECESRA